ncbi:MAG TPA: hypothetical protein VFZ25_02815 [Chloroflexota bacterium]|nr:hypothetical protein [Chloroflexota bacterium]
MAIDRGVPDWHVLRDALNRLQWGDGLTRDEMMNQSPVLRSPVMRLLPAEYCFPDAGSVMSYFEQMDREGRFQLANLPPPGGYQKQSPTGTTYPAHRYPPSVGSGYGSGHADSSAQTGVGRWGTHAEDDWT